MPIKIVSEDRRVEALSRAAVEMLSAYDNFFRREIPISAAELRACGLSDNACLRAALARAAAGNQPVLILAQSAGGNDVVWTCVGGGTTAHNPAAQRLTIDFSAAIFGRPELRSALQTKMLACIFAAADEESAP
ncbi:hypothetical protein [Sphingosinicella sp. BN140058]|uniref:hypothetical protein n=1 Tax=Sphingosinicella sp. BN140058 TaxID=1892855 RepID=UPI0010102DA3|nr:hypothetical protein [Sphingosinicella sp. BN140058]QAY76975.1 hypothetical protein ETR14_11055 [Sphingosinicella sp. BN140058]